MPAEARPMPRYDDDEDDRPRRRYADEDDDEYEERPRPKRRKKKAGPPVEIIAALVGGAGLLALTLVGAIVYFATRADKPARAARPAVGQPPPQVAPPLNDPAPAPPAAPPQQQQVTITGVRRATGFAGKPVLEIDYQVNGGFVPGRAVVMIKSREGTTEASIFGPLGMGPGGNSGTWKLEKFGFGGGFGGRLEVWVEQRMGFTGGIISNTFVVE